MKTARLLCIVLLLFFAVGSVFGVYGAPSPLKVHFLNVGQADAILIQTPNNHVMLIDAGSNSSGPGIMKYLNVLKIKRIDIVVATHPHEDHIGGLPEIIKSLPVGQIYMPKVVQSTQTFEDTLNAIQAKGLKINSAQAGVQLHLDPALTIDMIAPNNTEYEKINDYSAVIKLTYNKISFLFAGDAEKDSEREMLQAGYNLKTDVLKVGHHGGNTSTTGSFLNAVMPTYAIISVGEHNEYRHPSKNTLSRLKKTNAKVYRTDQNGTIVVETDGLELTMLGEDNKIAVPK